MRFFTRQILLGAALLMCWMPAHAYIDPGTGSALIQGVIAAIAAAGITLKLFWHRIVTFVSRKKSDPSPAAPRSAVTNSKHTSN